MLISFALGSRRKRSFQWNMGFRDWSLITGRGLQNGRAEHVKFYPYEKGVGGGKSFNHAEGRAQKVLA